MRSSNVGLVDHAVEAGLAVLNEDVITRREEDIAVDEARLPSKARLRVCGTLEEDVDWIGIARHIDRRAAHESGPAIDGDARIDDARIVDDRAFEALAVRCCRACPSIRAHPDASGKRKNPRLADRR